MLSTVTRKLTVPNPFVSLENIENPNGSHLPDGPARQSVVISLKQF
jgi:hypothetical protein